jgi:hypothetical protein
MGIFAFVLLVLSCLIAVAIRGTPQDSGQKRKPGNHPLQQEWRIDRAGNASFLQDVGDVTTNNLNATPRSDEIGQPGGFPDRPPHHLACGSH